jgi:hypothetical protein
MRRWLRRAEGGREMRQWNRVLAVAMLLTMAVACKSMGSGMHGAYAPTDRYAMAVLVPVNGCSVIGGPESHIAFPGKKVTWRVVNVCSDDTQLEIQILERTPRNAPENPFVEDLGRTPLRAGRGTDPKNSFQLTIKDASAFAPHAETRYKYRLQIKGRPDSGIDPELDIWR